jgi:adenosylmethionine-8-amino-7-oxononanoate aminotransferase
MSFRSTMSMQEAAKDHLWLHFTRHHSFADAEVPVIVRGEGVYLYDADAKRYLDGLAGLFVSQLGHGRADLADAAARQAKELAYMPLWSFAHPGAIELAARLAHYAPGSLNRVFFTSGGSEAVESAWKLAKSYFTLTGKPAKHKVLSRTLAYHGTTHGALSITGVPALKQPFEPLVPSTFRVPNTNAYRAPDHLAGDLDAFGVWAADQVALQIENEGPDTVAAFFVEPLQNSGGSIPPPPGYFRRIRELCDHYNVLLISDEVICAFGRLGYMFGCERYGYEPDIITCAKGITSGYAPLGAMIASDRLMEPFLKAGEMFAHGYTFGGHPVATAVALANLDAFENEHVLDRVRANEPVFRSTLERLLDIPIVGDVRGDGFFYSICLVKDKQTKQRFAAEETERVLLGFIATQLYAEGLHCRTDNRGDWLIQLSPPLLCTQQHFDEMEAILRTVLEKAMALL